MKIEFCREADDEDEHGIVAQVDVSFKDGVLPNRLGRKAIRLAENEFLAWLGHRWTDPPRIIRANQLFLPGRSGVMDRERLTRALSSPYSFPPRPPIRLLRDCLIVDSDYTFTLEDLRLIGAQSAVRSVRYIDEVERRRKRVALAWGGEGRDQALLALIRVMR